MNMRWISSLVGLCLVACINGQDDCGENIGRCDNVRTLSWYWVKAGSILHDFWEYCDNFTQININFSKMLFTLCYLLHRITQKVQSSFLHNSQLHFKIIFYSQLCEYFFQILRPTWPGRDGTWACLQQASCGKKYQLVLIAARHVTVMPKVCWNW